MHGLGLCIKLDSFVAHMLYARPFSYNAEVQIDVNQNKYFLSFNAYTTVFAWRAGNPNKNRT